MIKKLVLTFALWVTTALLISFPCHAATYYADFDLATGNNDGTTAANAWQTMLRAVAGTGGTQPTAGDIVRCQGTDTLGANLSLNGLSGDETTGMVRWIGMSDISAGTNDGTRAVLDGVDTYTCSFSTISYWHFENFEFTQMSGNGIDATGGNAFVYINCSFNNNATDGYDGLSSPYATFIRCTFYLNTKGCDGASNNRYLFSSFHDNTGTGLDVTSDSYILGLGCLMYDNGDDGVAGLRASAILVNCVVNGNTDDGIVTEAGGGRFISYVIGCRITNHSGAGDIGLNANTEILYHGWNYYEDNDGANIQNATLALEILDDGSATDAEDQADTNEGYTDLTDGSEDFSLRDDATSRRTGIAIPLN